jgi:hypothetical protein
LYSCFVSGPVFNGNMENSCFSLVLVWSTDCSSSRMAWEAIPKFWNLFECCSWVEEFAFLSNGSGWSLCIQSFWWIALFLRRQHGLWLADWFRGKIFRRFSVTLRFGNDSICSVRLRRISLFCFSFYNIDRCVKCWEWSIAYSFQSVE